METQRTTTFRLSYTDVMDLCERYCREQYESLEGSATYNANIALDDNQEAKLDGVTITFTEIPTQER